MDRITVLLVLVALLGVALVTLGAHGLSECLALGA
jgi:hypothetical protein